MNIQVEPLKKVSHLLNAIIVEYYEKTDAQGNMPPLAMNWDEAAKLEAKDMFIVITNRDHDKLTGFVTYYIGPHPHHKNTIFASCGTLAVKVEHRGKGIAGRLLKAAEPLLKMYDVKMIIHGYRTLYKTKPIFKAHGYELTELQYMKAI